MINLINLRSKVYQLLKDNTIYDIFSGIHPEMGYAQPFVYIQQFDSEDLNNVKGCDSTYNTFLVESCKDYTNTATWIEVDAIAEEIDTLLKENLVLDDNSVINLRCISSVEFTETVSNINRLRRISRYELNIISD